MVHLQLALLVDHDYSLQSLMGPHTKRFPRILSIHDELVEIPEFPNHPLFEKYIDRIRGNFFCMGPP